MNLNLETTNNFQKQMYELAQNYFEPNGYFNYKPVDAEGATPWYTYPAISYLKNIISKDNRVFEYGAGYSTMFFNKHCQQVVSVEHDRKWYDDIANTNPHFDIRLVEEGAGHDPLIDQFISLNLEMPTKGDRPHDTCHGLLNLEFGNYATKILEWPKNHFDIVVVDGMARILSGYIAAQSIAHDGIIILDNSNRWQYNALQQYLIDQGFGRIDFWGPGPVLTLQWCTSFFSRQYKVKSNSINRLPLSGDLGW